MIVLEEQGDIFESGFQTLVCPVNKVGVMGAGLALAFKNRYPGLFEFYKQICFSGFPKDGFAVWDSEDGKKILLLPTKNHFKNSSNEALIVDGLRSIRDNATAHKITSIAMPAIGCGCGKLEWSRIKKLIYHFMGDDDFNIEVGVYLPH